MSHPCDSIASDVIFNQPECVRERIRLHGHMFHRSCFTRQRPPTYSSLRQTTLARRKRRTTTLGWKVQLEFSLRGQADKMRHQVRRTSLKAAWQVLIAAPTFSAAARVYMLKGWRAAHYFVLA